MKESDQKYIRDNRLKLSMLDMSKHLGMPYSRVRSFMVAQDLMVSKQDVYRIRNAKMNRANNCDPYGIQ